MDLNAIRQRIADLNSKQKRSGKIWKPTDEHTIRLLARPGIEDPFVELLFHYDIGDQKVNCPTNYGKECVICVLCDQLKAWKGPDGKDKPKDVKNQDWEFFRKIQAKQRYFVPMVERKGKELEGPLWWELSFASYNKLLSICGNEDWNTTLADTGGGTNILTNVNKALDITISQKKPFEKGNKTDRYQTAVEERKVATKLSDDKAVVAALLAGIPAINDVVTIQEPLEVQRILKKFLGAASSESTDSSKGLEYNSGAASQAASAPSNSAEKAVVGTTSMDDAFENLKKDSAAKKKAKADEV